MDKKSAPKDRTKKSPGKRSPTRKNGSYGRGGPPKATAVAAGLSSRTLAIDLLEAVFHRRQSLDEALAATYARKASSDTQSLDGRDRGFARLLAATVLRRHGQLKAVLKSYLNKPLPHSGRRAELILLIGAAQLLFLGSAPHAVINTAVTLSRQQRGSARFDKLINAVLRRVSESGLPEIAKQDAAALNFPGWMLERWQTFYGPELARAIALASLNEAALDLTVRHEPATWAEKLDAVLLTTGSVRRKNDGRIDALPGFDDGAWWVQDAAAALPVRLLGNVADMSVADLCAAPGGKTAQLAAAGAKVTAVDISDDRLARVRENLVRLSLDAELVAADAATWLPDRLFDAVLVDAPCTASGTIRRHPDIIHLKQADDVGRLSKLQSQILANAARLVKPGGIMIYCTCSLEPEEGEARIESFLEATEDFQHKCIKPSEFDDFNAPITARGDLRTLPHYLPNDDPLLAGMDGFYASRLRRQV